MGKGVAVVLVSGENGLVLVTTVEKTDGVSDGNSRVIACGSRTPISRRFSTRAGMSVVGFYDTA